MDTLQRLQNWYENECNEDWEHSFGVKIDTIDNPGWSVTVDLEDTSLENERYIEYSHGLGDGNEPCENDWIVTKVEDKKLIEIIDVFLRWANKVE